MSSTAGIQNLLVNVFRPVYVYDPAGTTTLFTPKLEMSNIDNYSGNTLSVFTAAVGDSASNVYVGSNAGNPYTLIKACSNVTALGYGAGSNISNVSNSVYLGYYAGAGAVSASSVIAIGSNTNGNGVSNVYIGNSAGGIGSSNIFLGNNTTGSGSGNILLGNGISSGTSSSLLQIGSTIYGNLSTNWIGIGTPTYGVIQNRLDVSGDTQIMGQLGINAIPGTRTLYVNGNFKAQDAQGNFLDFKDGLTTSSGGLSSSQGTTAVTGGATTIGTLKKGVVIVSAVDSASSANRAARILLAYTTSNVTDIGSDIAVGNTSITISSSNIQITDSTNATYTWSITYFPVL